MMERESLVRLRVSGLSAEKLLNAAREKGIVLRKISRQKNRSLLVLLPCGQEAAFRALAEEKGFALDGRQAMGLPHLALWMKKRRGLLLGAALAAGMLLWSLGYVWQVRVENAGPYEAEVKAFLEELNVRPGRRRSEISLLKLREKLEWRLPQVKWVRTEWQGVSLFVRLEQGVPPPETAVLTGHADVVAAEDGVIKRLTAFAGTPVVKEGDFVRAGQVLIRGEEKGKQGEAVRVKAQGEASARVWVTARVRLPLTGLASASTGRASDRRVICTPFFSWSAKETPDYLTSDIEKTPVILGGAWMPVWAVREDYREVFLTKTERNAEEVKEEAEKAAYHMLNQALCGDEIVDKWINCSMIEGDTITAEATAEVIRNIGRCRGDTVP